MKLPELKDCTAPVTAEAATRRGMYQVETKRQEIAEGFGKDYMAFLKHCDIRLNIRDLADRNFDRVHELTQRTNQMNFSGNHYDRGSFEKNPIHTALGHVRTGL